MSIISRLATSLGRKDEVPNQLLAQAIADAGDEDAVKELVEHLAGKDKNIQSDCVKVLYEIGQLQPSMIAEYSGTFVSLLGSRNNRLVWGAMTALDTITLTNPEPIHAALATIIDIADQGSVITKDHAVGILIKLCTMERYAGDSFALLVKLLERCPTNQLPMYAENAVGIINGVNKTAFLEVLSSRLGEIDKDSKRKRVEKVIAKVNKVSPLRNEAPR